VAGAVQGLLRYGLLWAWVLPHLLDAARGAHNDAGLGALDVLLVLLDVHAPEVVAHLDVGQQLAEAGELVGDLQARRTR
jgi:hypothetical protein